MKMNRPSTIKTTLALFIATATLIIIGFPVLAGTIFPWDGPLSKLSQNLTGPTTTSIALIGLFVAGGALVFGGDLASFAKKVTWMILALSLMLSGPAFLNVIADGKTLPAASALI
jgi:type IV secretory pathway VirB2 component (pilin)